MSVQEAQTRAVFFHFFSKIIVGGDIALELILAGLLPHSPTLGLRDHPLALSEEMPIQSRRLFTH